MSDLFQDPERLSSRIEDYFEFIETQPMHTVQVGKNFYQRKVPVTEDGLCSYLGVQRADVKRVLDDATADSSVKKLLIDALVRIRAWLTQAALLGELDATVAKVVLASSILSTGVTDAEIEAKKGLRIRIEGMDASMVEKASR